jgi:hypothetical protein
MTRGSKPYVPAIAAAVAAALWLAPALAQQQGGASWQTQTTAPGVPAPAAPGTTLAPGPGGLAPPPVAVPPNTTVVPRTAPPEARPPPVDAGSGQVSLVALLTQDGQSIEQGLVWRVFHERPGPDGKLKLAALRREASPSLRLEAGDYIVNVAFGRAHLTRKITVASARAVQERFVLNAGGLRLVPALANGEPIADKAVSYDILSDERDQYGQRVRVMGAAKPGLVIRLNAGIYSIVGTYGDANAVARADVTVEAGKLTEATLTHAAARVTFKLVARPGGDAIADTQWNVADARGETVKDSVGALPTHIFAPGTYTVSARNGADVFRRTFAVQAGDVAQVEVIRGP